MGWPLLNANPCNLVEKEYCTHNYFGTIKVKGFLGENPGDPDPPAPKWDAPAQELLEWENVQDQCLEWSMLVRDLGATESASNRNGRVMALIGLGHEAEMCYVRVLGAMSMELAGKTLVRCAVYAC